MVVCLFILLEQVLGRCFLTVMQVHFQFLSQALQKVQPVAQSCFSEAAAPGRKDPGRRETPGVSPTAELEEATRSWKGAREVGLRCWAQAPAVLNPSSRPLEPGDGKRLPFPWLALWQPRSEDLLNYLKEIGGMCNKKVNPANQT